MTTGAAALRAGRLPRGVWLALAAAAVTAVAFLTPPSVFLGLDWLQMHLPYKQYAAASVAHGRLPLWNPCLTFGRPFLADLETAVLYPPNLLFLVLEASLALALLLAAHVGLALAGTFRLARSLGAATTPAALAAGSFALGGPLAARLSAGQIGFAEGTCYLPLLFLLAARLQDRPSWRRLGGLAAGLALQLLCGHPQIAWITWLGLGAFVLGRGLGPSLRPLVAGILGVLAAMVAAFGLAAPALLPFLELTSQSNRLAPTLRFASGGSMEWWQWASLLVPDGGRRVFYWEFDLYAGAFATLAGVAGLALLRDRGVRGLALAGLLGALVAAGPRTPVFALLYHLVPGLAGLHIHSRAGVLPSLALIVAAAAFVSRPAGRQTIAVVSGLTLAGGVAVLAAYRLLGPTPLRPAVAQLLLLAVLAVLALLVSSPRRSLARTAAVLLPLVVAWDLLNAQHAAKAAWAAPRPAYLVGERQLAAALSGRSLLPASVPPRVLVPPYVARADAGMIYGWSSVAGYNALTLDRTWQYLHRTLGLSLPVDENTYPSPEVYERGAFPYREASLVAGWDAQREALVLQTDPDPRAYLVPQVRRVARWQEAVARMAAGQDVHGVALVEEDGLLPEASASRPPLPGGAAEVTTFGPERVAVRTEWDRPSLLVLGEAWYPGWTAEVDGRERPCVPANGWMRAVALGPGAHVVVFRYRSRWLVPGIGLCLATLLLLIVGARRGGPGSGPASEHRDVQRQDLPPAPGSANMNQ